MMRCGILPSDTACKCKQIASMWMPSTNSVPGSRTGQACIMNAFKLRLAFSIFSGSIWNLGSFKEPLEVIEFFIGESRVVNRWFIVYSMGQFDLFGLRRETLQQRLNSPGFALARAFPKQRGRLFGSALLNQRGIETFLESQPTPCDASRIPGLSRLPPAFISSLECRLRISGLSKFESTVVCHWICLEFICAGHFWMWFVRYPGWIQGAFETCPRWAPTQDGMPCPSRYGFARKEFLGSSGGQFVT